MHIVVISPKVAELMDLDDFRIANELEVTEITNTGRLSSRGHTPFQVKDIGRLVQHAKDLLASSPHRGQPFTGPDTQALRAFIKRYGT